MDEIFEEIQEDLREEKLRAFWQKHGRRIIIGVVSVLAITLVGIGIKHFRDQRHLTAAENFLSAQKLIEQGNTAEAIATLQSLTKEDDTTYRALARLRLITLDGVPAAEKPDLYQAIAADTAMPSSLKDYARFMAVLIQADTADIKVIPNLIKDLEPLQVKGHPLAPLAYELTAALYQRQGDKNGATQALAQATAAPEASRALRLRTTSLLNHLASQDGTKA